MKVRTTVFRFLGGLLLFAASVIAFLWFYWLAPFRNTNNPSWLFDHTSRGLWIEVQKQLRRTGPDHDSSIDVGYYGDKKWTEWVIQTLQSHNSNREIGDCGIWPYHLIDALSDMTNQSCSNNLEWIAWWTTNKSKTQVEWIREGFAQRGINLHQPLTTNDIVALLRVISSSHGGLHFNAQRWLRDAHFRPREFYFAAIPTEDKDQIIHGLVDYAVWYGEHWDDRGELPIDGSDSNYRLAGSRFERPQFRWTLYFIIIATALGGCFLLRLSRPKTHS